MPTTTTGVATEFINFTRASNATVTDSNGVIKWAAHNLLLASEQFDNSNWTKSANVLAFGSGSTANAIVAPNGTTSADLLTENSTATVDRRLNQAGITATAGSNYTIGIFAKTNGRLLQINFGGGEVTSDPRANYDISTGVLGTVDAGITATITSMGSGWYLCTATVNAATTTLTPVFSFITTSTAVRRETYTGDGAKGFYLWGAHLYRSDLGGMQANTSAYPMYNPTTPKNLLGFTENFDNAAWTKTSATVSADSLSAPNGLNTSDTLTASAGTVFPQVLQATPAYATAQMVSVYAKAGTYGILQLFNAYGAAHYANFNLSAGVVGTKGASVSDSGMVALGNGWYRCWAYFAALDDVGIGMAGSTSATKQATWATTGSETIFLWGAQFSDSASLDTYTPNHFTAPSAAAYYGPRRDFDPVTLAAKGLLVEEQRANLAVQSGAFDSGSWSKSNSTVTANAATSPSGDNTADKLIEDTATGLHLVSQGISLTAVSYTFSCYAKAAERTWFSLATNSVANVSAFFNLANGTIGTVGSSCTATISTLGNGWYRCAITFTAAAGTNNMHCRVSTADNVSSYTGDGTSGIYIWGAQVEAGSFATSYIPVGATTAGATRLADEAKVSTAAFPYSQTGGTLVAAWQQLAPSVSGAFYNIAALRTDANNRVNLYVSATSMVPTVASRAAGVTDFSSTFTAISANSLNKIGIALSANNSIAACNGVLGTLDTTVSVPPVDTMPIGSDGSAPLNGWMRQITYIPRRLSDAELTARTA